MRRRNDKMSDQARRMLRSAVWLGGVVAMGTVGFELTEGWGAWKSFYMTLITVTTVGHQDFNVSPAGQRVSALVIVTGIAAVSYALGQFAQGLIESEFNRERRTMNQIRSLDGHYIVAGLGRIGVHVCEQLEDAGAPFVVIDNAEAPVAKARERGWLALEGDATDDKTLMKCRVDRAKSFAAVTNEDSVNIVATLTARDMAPELYILARAETAEAVRKIARAGASRVISPVREGAVTIAAAMMCPSIAEAHQPDVQHDALTFAEVRIGQESPAKGRSFEEFFTDYPQVVFVALRRDGALGMRPDPSDSLAAGDGVVIGGPKQAVTMFESYAVPQTADHKRAA